LFLLIALLAIGGRPVSGLTNRFGARAVVDNVDLLVPRGCADACSAGSAHRVGASIGWASAP
jgi:hypothetical protein